MCIPISEFFTQRQYKLIIFFVSLSRKQSQLIISKDIQSYVFLACCCQFNDSAVYRHYFLLDQLLFLFYLGVNTIIFIGYIVSHVDSKYKQLNSKWLFKKLKTEYRFHSGVILSRKYAPVWSWWVESYWWSLFSKCSWAGAVLLCCKAGCAERED